MKPSFVSQVEERTGKKKAEKQHTEERKTGKCGIMEVQMNKIFTKDRRNNWI